MRNGATKPSPNHPRAGGGFDAGSVVRVTPASHSGRSLARAPAQGYLPGPLCAVCGMAGDRLCQPGQPDRDRDIGRGSVWRQSGSGGAAGRSRSQPPLRGGALPAGGGNSELPYPVHQRLGGRAAGKNFTRVTRAEYSYGRRDRWFRVARRHDPLLDRGEQAAFSRQPGPGPERGFAIKFQVAAMGRSHQSGVRE